MLCDEKERKSSPSLAFPASRNIRDLLRLLARVYIQMRYYVNPVPIDEGAKLKQNDRR